MSGSAPIAVALFNDNGDYPHVGCLAVSDAHRRMLRREGALVRHAYFQRDWHTFASGTLDQGIAAALASPELRRVFDEVDAVVVNGEGTIHHRQGWYLVAILAAAQRVGLPTYLVNAVLQEVDAARDVLMALDDCTVRDAASARYLSSLGVPHRVVHDSFFEAGFGDEPLRDFTDRLVITDCHPARTAEFAGPLQALAHAWPGMTVEYPLEGQARLADWGHAVADLRGAFAMVTGRHHGACLALAAGVPFVTLPSNTWKIEGLLDTLEGYPHDARDAARPLAERVAAAVEARAWFVDAANTLRRSLPLQTFARLRSRPSPLNAIDVPAVPRDSDRDLVGTVAAATEAGAAVLHAGCGRGALVSALAEAGFESWGTDIAIGLAPTAQTPFVSSTPMCLPFADDRFATVVASSSWLDHLEADDLDIALGELARVARDVVVLKVSGLPIRTERAARLERPSQWWEHRLSAHGMVPAGAEQSDSNATILARKAPMTVSA